MDSYSQKKHDSHPALCSFSSIINFEKKIVCDVIRPSYYHNTIIQPKLDYPASLTALGIT